MTIDVFRYRLPLISPVALRHGMLTERTGFVVRLEEDGLEGWGEAAPLDGFSRESPQEAHEALRKISLSEDLSSEALERVPSSARFALESAVLDLQAQRQGMSMAEVLNPTSVALIHLNALITTVGDEAVEEAMEYVRCGFQAIKMKVGRAGLKSDIQSVNAILDLLHDAVELRLDANQAWSFEDALEFANRVDVTRLAYVEEPLAQPERLLELAGKTGVRVALDESLVGSEPSGLEDQLFAEAIILKPSIAGGLDWAVHMAKRANELGIVPIVSNAFECGVGLRTHVALAAAWAPAPCGLSTYARFAEGLYSERLPMNGPLINVVEVLAPRTPDLDKLELIP